MKIDYQVAEHPGDDDLVRLLDGEAAEGDRLGLQGHLEGCITCGERYSELSDVSDWMRRNVAVLDADVEVDELARARALSGIRVKGAPPARRTGFGTSGFRAAATIAVIVAASLSVTPLRAWIFENVERIAAGFEEAPTVEVPAATAPLAGALVTFSPSASTFRLELDAVQGSGTLAFEFGDADQASAQVIGGSGEMLAVLPVGLWIDNDADSSASYRITLPASFIREVEVVAAGEVVVRQSVGEAPGTIVVDLARAQAVQ